MSSYETRLDDFAQGKRLLRLPGPVRDQDDASCDAFGSSQPKTLHGVKDLEAQRYYFVGDTCLKELVGRGAVLRRYGKEPGPNAYQGEMRRRAQALVGDDHPEESQQTPSSDRKSGPADTYPRLGPPGNNNPQPLFPVVLVVENPEHYRAVVSLVSAQGALQGNGQAQESRFEETWRLGKEPDRVLEQVKEERPGALGQCLTRAWQDALDQCQRPVPLLPDETAGTGYLQPDSLAGPMVAQIQLLSTLVGSDPKMNAPNGH